MSYQANIPQANTFISVSQGDILNNFGQIDTSWNVNHVGFNAANTGKHNFVEFPNQGGDPAGAAAEMTLFSKLSGGISDLFYKRNNAGSSFQLTGVDPYNNAVPREVSAFLPGGFTIKMGNRDVTQVSTPGTWDGSKTSFITPFTTAIFSVVISMQRGNTSTHVFYVSNNNPPSTTGFNIRTDDNSWDKLYYFAIGI